MFLGVFIIANTTIRVLYVPTYTTGLTILSKPITSIKGKKRIAIVSPVETRHAHLHTWKKRCPANGPAVGYEETNMVTLMSMPADSQTFDSARWWRSSREAFFGYLERPFCGSRNTPERSAVCFSGTAIHGLPASQRLDLSPFTLNTCFFHAWFSLFLEGRGKGTILRMLRGIKRRE